MLTVPKLYHRAASMATPQCLVHRTVFLGVLRLRTWMVSGSSDSLHTTNAMYGKIDEALMLLNTLWEGNWGLDSRWATISPKPSLTQFKFHRIFIQFHIWRISPSFNHIVPHSSHFLLQSHHPLIQEWVWMLRVLCQRQKHGSRRWAWANWMILLHHPKHAEHSVFSLEIRFMHILY